MTGKFDLSTELAKELGHFSMDFTEGLYTDKKTGRKGQRIAPELRSKLENPEFIKKFTERIAPAIAGMTTLGADVNHVTNAFRLMDASHTHKETDAGAFELAGMVASLIACEMKRQEKMANGLELGKNKKADLKLPTVLPEYLCKDIMEAGAAMKSGQPTEKEEIDAMNFSAKNSRGAVMTHEELMAAKAKMDGIKTRGDL